MSFFAPARPGPVFAQAWVERAGKRTTFYEGCLKDAAGKVLAKGSSTILMMDRAKIEAAARDARGGV